VVNKIRQYLPEWRRSPDDVLSALVNEHLFSEGSISRATNVLEQSTFIPTVVAQLVDHPEKVTLAFEEIRKHSESQCTDRIPSNLCSHVVTEPSGVRFSVRGNVLALKEPRSTLGKYFCDPLPVRGLRFISGWNNTPLREQASVLDPVPSESLSELGMRPVKQVSHIA
jgi:hypothetical protein